MGRFQPFKNVGMSLIGYAIFAATPVAAAGSCGGFYAVDAPTTLTRVAQACRVSFASLREANPGVDPGNVRPGEHLAVPVGISHMYVSTKPDVSADSFNKLGARIPFTEDLGFRDRTDRRIRLLAAGAVPGTPPWLKPEAAKGGHYSSSAPLSFQKVAALRIETAGAPAVQNPVFVSGVGNAQISNGYRLPDYGQIGVAPLVVAPPSSSLYSLTGVIDNFYEGCITLKTTDSKIWRLAAAPVSDDMIGKTITVWGAATSNNVCGGGDSIDVSHAVFAEPWAEE